MGDIKTKQEMIDEFILADIGRIAERLKVIRTLLPTDLDESDAKKLIYDLKNIASNASYLVENIEARKIRITSKDVQKL